MSTLNRGASEAMVANSGVHAATDVTGFGLLGHGSEMLGRGDVGLRIEAEAVPVLDEVWQLARDGVVPGGTRRNLASVEPLMDWSERLTEEQRLVLADAQTSGGLLIAVAANEADALLAALPEAWRIGTFTDRLGRIEVL